MFGVFLWNSDGKYRREDAVKVYKAQGMAQRYADKLNGPSLCNVVGDSGGWVVRPV